MIQPDGKENYPDEFKRDAVALYRDTEGATITAIAAELGISEATLTRLRAENRDLRAEKTQAGHRA